MLRVFIDASSIEARRRLTAQATKAGWRIAPSRGEADVVLSEPMSPSTALPARAGDEDPDEEPPHEALTPREWEVLALLAEGTGNREIAQRLGVSEHTVKFHLSAIFGKLGAATRTEAVRRALRWGWVSL